MQMLRGAPLTKEEKKELNIRGRDILRKTGVRYDGKELYDSLRQRGGWAGFASYYIGSDAMWDETELVNKAEIKIYKELIFIDEKLGTKMTEQLELCVKWSYRKDLFKV